MIATTTYCGPATVLESEEGGIRIHLPEGAEATARAAFVVPYQAVPGDQLLVLSGEGETFYAVGLLQGIGRTTLRVDGDLTIEAPNGRIDLSAGHGLRLLSKEGIDAEARRATWRVGKFETFAERVIQRAGDVYHWIEGFFQTKSRRMRTVVDTQYQENPALSD